MSTNLTDREKDNLIKFWEAFNARNNPLLDDPWTPSFGHAPANLIFTDPEDNAGKPDDHYYQAAGQEPPTESQDGDGSVFKGIVYLTLFYALLAVVVMLLTKPCIWGC